MFAVDQEPAAYVIRVDSDLDTLNVGELESIIALASDGADRSIIVSLVDCPYCDSSALTAFVKAHRTLDARFAIVVPPENRLVQRILEITGLRDYLPVYPNIEAAMAAGNGTP